ncbi:bifunctional 3'-5' exonuclease/DNA polymerase, partial [Micromonospora sp. GCM10011541]
MSQGRGRIASVLVAVVADERGGGVLQPLDLAGRPTGPAEPVTDLAAAVTAREAADRPRWVWASGATVYPALLRAGVRLDRCHDV